MLLFIDNIKIFKFMVFMIEKVTMVIIFVAMAMIINSIDGFDDICCDNSDISSGYKMLIGDESG